MAAAVGLVAVAAALAAVVEEPVVEPARVVAAELAVREAPAAEEALPEVPGGRLELGPLAEPERLAQGAAALGPEPALLRGPPERVVGPRLLEQERLGYQEAGEPLGRRELEVPGSDPGPPAVEEVRDVLKPRPPPEVRAARMLSPCSGSSEPI